MGKSKSIEEKEQEDAKFREFMKKLEEESRQEEEKLYTAMMTIVKNFYEGNDWDYARLFGSRRSDYQAYSDWGLDRVINIINSIATALSGKDYPSDKVPGSNEASKSTIEKAKEFAGVFAGDYDLIIARVTSLITGVLSQFSIKSSTQRRSVQQDQALSGGLHLFFASSGAVDQNSSFFSNQYIGSFQIVFEAYMSVAEARAIALIQILKTTEAELVYLNDLILTIREEQTKSLKEILKKSPQDYKSTMAAYTVALDATKEERAKLVEEYDKYNSVTTTVDRLFSSLDLSEFEEGKSPVEDALPIDLLFNQWEAGIARRYIREKLAQEKQAA